MLANPQPPRIHLTKGWHDCVKSAVLHAMALAHYDIVYARAWAADSINARVRLEAENDRLHEACALLREEIRIKDTRIAQIAETLCRAGLHLGTTTVGRILKEDPLPSPGDAAPWTTQAVSTRNTSSATRASSSGAAC